MKRQTFLTRAMWVVFLAGALDGLVWADAIKGVAQVIDGDTIEIEGEKIGLAGIDALELEQWCRNGHGYRYKCGRDAAAFLRAYIAKDNDIVYCRNPASELFEKRIDRYGRWVAQCAVRHSRTIERGEDIAVDDLSTTMVSYGWALDIPNDNALNDSIGKEAEALARKHKMGIWTGEFVKPWDWLDGKRLD